ncbi:hypothetical protein [Massilia sp. Dwa41.01b]|uniref:hypothetical protein n=1 Tax=Massilia sp. Dwa41.01b TaxID=2709302 RepID=UPI001E584238|nr:hypothetical protein [Massilia sp. Dwa41.01b]
MARTIGEVTIVADGYDQMDGNLARRRLGLYKLGYQVLHADGSPVAGYEQPLITQVYDRLPREREAVKLVYADSSGITVYGSKATRFAYAVNNRLQDGQAVRGSWRVGGLAPGTTSCASLRRILPGRWRWKGGTWRSRWSRARPCEPSQLAQGTRSRRIKTACARSSHPGDAQSYSVPIASALVCVTTLPSAGQSAKR